MNGGRTWLSFGDLVGWASASLLLFGCSKANHPNSHGTGESERIAVDGAAVTVGFKTGHLRENVSLERFEISPSPITMGQFNQCVKAKACHATPLATDANVQASDDDAKTDSEDDSIAYGLAPSDAESYCSWVGGALPSLPQWLLAARGAAPQRFSWGESLPTCAQHPGGVDVAQGRDSVRERVRQAAGSAACGNSATARYKVAQYPAGASTNGLLDVLLAPTELLMKDAESIFSACRGNKGYCGVYGVLPGAIDFVRSIESDGHTTGGDEVAERPATSTPSFAFRCVWSQGGEQ